MKRFHVHVYFETNDLETARLWSERARLAGLFEFIHLHKRPVGPHPTGMIEAHFDESRHAAVVDWIGANRGNFSVLIHQDTGDDYTDHTEGILWLGKELPLDFKFFELIQADPALSIHKPKA